MHYPTSDTATTDRKAKRRSWGYQILSHFTIVLVIMTLALLASWTGFVPAKKSVRNMELHSAGARHRESISGYQDWHGNYNVVHIEHAH
jgi:hypothetical protein